MRAISLWQPWASAMATGAKSVETRHWSTNVRGPVAIHAAQRRVISDLGLFQCMSSWRGALAPLSSGNPDFQFADDLPFGAIVAVGELVDVRATVTINVHEDWLTRNHFPDKSLDLNNERRAELRWSECEMGDYSQGRFAWFFERIRPLSEPVPFKAHQGFFNVPDELLEGRL